MLSKSVEALRVSLDLDPEGVLRYKAGTTLNVGRSAEETLRVIRRANGGLCQAREGRVRKH